MTNNTAFRLIKIIFIGFNYWINIVFSLNNQIHIRIIKLETFFCLEISKLLPPPPALYAPMNPINGFYQYLVIESMKYLGSKCWDSLRALRNLFWTCWEFKPWKKINDGFFFNQKKTINLPYTWYTKLGVICFKKITGRLF